MTDATHDIGAETRERTSRLVWPMRIVSVSAAALSAMLLYQSLSGADVPGCGAGSSCDEVLSSPWSKVLGIPVAAPAILVYLAALAATFLVTSASLRTRSLGWRVLIFASLLAAAAGVWFTTVQVMHLGQLCKWCTATHAHGVVLAILVLVAAPLSREHGRVSPAGAGLLVVGACAAVVALAAVQTLSPTSTMRVYRLKEGVSTGLDPAQQPILGDPAAETVLVELFDYNCPHCRKLHHFLEQARQRYGEQLAIVPLPVPLDADCNFLVKETEPRFGTSCELATTALAVWRAKPAAFAAFHGWAMSGDTPPTPEEALDHAVSLVGADAMGEALLDPRIKEMLTSHARLFSLIGGNLPQIVAPEGLIFGRPEEAQELFQSLEDLSPLEPIQP